MILDFYKAVTENPEKGHIEGESSVITINKNLDKSIVLSDAQERFEKIVADMARKYHEPKEETEGEKRLKIIIENNRLN